MLNIRESTRSRIRWRTENNRNRQKTKKEMEKERRKVRVIRRNFRKIRADDTEFQDPEAKS